ncbi:putative short chain dehydrogenase/oxidoreductase [Viridothelium virens]|uniref:Putative short chain dehydrogenase/oxidoreductase n=1 Tax=Viridothelium virens TaxID=1048519 RepID=A0A6A6H3V2_VIRVR|nr:putative short chain dehydrogenase/oxidoreductase [Viridothelium virens]
MSLNLDGKTCIITGSGGGLGKAIAETFLEAHANVVICDIDGKRLETTSEELRLHGPLLAVQTDITSEESAQTLFNSAISKFGQVDFLINNAGIMDRFLPVGELDKETWDRVLAINLTAPYELSKRAINHILGRESPKGAIVNITSIAGVMGHRGGAAYTVSKHGLIGLTKNTAAFYGKKGIRCNAILPGAMATNIGDSASKGANEEGLEIARRTFAVEPPMCEVSDVANLCLYLCSDNSAIVNGACVSADGGWAAY